jgi:hypothetical protein
MANPTDYQRANYYLRVVASASTALPSICVAPTVQYGTLRCPLTFPWNEKFTPGLPSSRTFVFLENLVWSRGV